MKSSARKDAIVPARIKSPSYSDNELGLLLTNAEEIPNPSYNQNTNGRDDGFTLATNAVMYVKGHFNADGNPKQARVANLTILSTLLPRPSWPMPFTRFPTILISPKLKKVATTEKPHSPNSMPLWFRDYAPPAKAAVATIIFREAITTSHAFSKTGEIRNFVTVAQWYHSSKVK